MKLKPRGCVSIILALLFCVMLSCIAPEAIKTEIQGIRNDMGQLQKVSDELSLWKKSVQAETINYGGAGWVVIGTGTMAIIFAGSGLLLVRAFMRRGSLLTLLTCAVQKVGKHSPEVVQAIKEQLKIEISNGGSFTKHDMNNLGHFARKKGTFAEQKPVSEV